ncbi:MAG: hypothetical protein ACO1O3_05820 [Sphingobium sp.]
MTRRGALVAAAIAAPLIATGWLLWRSQGVMIWLQGAILYCL